MLQTPIEVLEGTSGSGCLQAGGTPETRRVRAIFAILTFLKDA
jgi:hypothetical protein